MITLSRPMKKLPLILFFLFICQNGLATETGTHDSAYEGIHLHEVVYGTGLVESDLKPQDPGDLFMHPFYVNFGFVINSLLNERQQVTGFLFGSSMGSKMKTLLGGKKKE